MNEEPAGKIQRHGAGWKKRAGLLGLLLVAVLAGLIWLALPPKEPAYQGKPLDYWLSRYATNSGFMGDPKNTNALECRNAMSHIGTNAIPFLLRILRAKDSALKMEVMDLAGRQNFINLPFSSVEDQKQKAEIGFNLLGDLASNAVPALVEIYAHTSSDESKWIADAALKQLYPAPGVATPYWVPPEERVQWYMDAGLVKLGSGATSNALLAFSQAINLSPTNADAYVSRGDAKFQLQDFKGAIMDINQGMALSPSNEYAYFSRGLCKFNLKDFKGAEADLTAAIHLDTNNTDIYNYRGLARANLRDLTNAVSDLNKAIEISPQNATGYRDRGMVEGMQKEYELALADTSKSIELDDHDEKAYILRGHIKTALREYQVALPDFDKAIALNPTNAAAYVSRGADRVYMDDFDHAAADLEKGLQLDPKSVAAFIVRGFLKQKRGDQDDGALADFEHAVELAPQMPETHGMLGMFEYKSAQWEPALANCRQAMKLGAVSSVTDINSCIWLIRAQSGEEAGANAELNAYLKSLPDAKTNDWSAITAHFFTGGLTESNFLSLATTSAKRSSAVKGQVCDSFYFAGMKHKLAGDKPGAAGLFQKCLDTKDDNDLAYMNAAIEMRVLKKP